MGEIISLFGKETEAVLFVSSWEVDFVAGHLRDAVWPHLQALDRVPITKSQQPMQFAEGHNESLH